jgi:predicted amidohydrolase YtcJ
MLFDELGHNCIINSALIRKSGITAETPVPMGGKVVIEDGKPTGMLCESGMLLASSFIFRLYPDAKIRTGTKKILDLWASMGYTGVVDLLGAPFGRITKPEILRAMEADGTLPVRVNFMYTFFNRDEIEDALVYKGHDTEMVRFGGLKIFIDGAYAAGQAYTTDKNLKGDHTLFYVSTDDSQGEEYNIYRIIEKINEVGLNVHYHVQGDKAIEVVLDGIQKAKEKNGTLTSTHTLIHLAFPTKEHIKRIKAFDGHVVTTVQPGFWSVEDDTVKYYGEKAKRCYPVKELIDAGVSVGMSTDFSVSPIELAAPTTIMGIAAQGAGEPENHPPLTIASMIKGFSAGSAATTTTANETGKLHIGYKADMVVYDKDLFEVPLNELKADNPKVLSTWVGGCRV